MILEFTVGVEMNTARLPLLERGVEMVRNILQAQDIVEAEHLNNHPREVNGLPL